jgi:hypothetical protein
VGDLAASRRPRPDRAGAAARALKSASGETRAACRDFMAGHSKWANIQHRKGRQDEKRGKVWTRLIREIVVAARHGGADLTMNPRLRLAVEKAKAANMPADTIKKNVDKATGNLEGTHYDEVRYEGYGIAGAAILIDQPVRRCGVVEHLVRRRRDRVPLHERLRERLRALEHGRRSRRAEDAKAPGAEDVDRSRSECRFRADDGEIDPLLDSERGERFEVGDGDIPDARLGGRAGVA